MKIENLGRRSKRACNNVVVCTTIKNRERGESKKEKK
jgi:hypothetical protein